jgi:hypothetical protein
MQTLIDPFELASRTLPVPLPVDLPAPAIAAEPAVEQRPAAPKVPRSPDSSGRLRCWCSED